MAASHPSVAVDWYFDLVSPFSYLQLETFADLPPGIAIVPTPILFGAVLKHWGQLGPAEIAPKRRHTYRYCQWLAGRRGVAFRLPPRHPFSPLQAMRILAALGPTTDQVRTAFRFVFAEGRCPDTPDELAALGDRLGVDADIAGSQEAKDALRALTEEAIGRGVFGVPTLHVAGESFWGDDGTAMMLDYLADPAMFRSEAMRRIDEIPQGVVRRT
jgi:2-hydroxychromene-2-carboxylate isomerase